MFQKEKVKQVLNSSTTLVREASNLQQNTLNALEQEAAETEKRIDRVGIQERIKKGEIHGNCRKSLPVAISIVTKASYM